MTFIVAVLLSQRLWWQAGLVGVVLAGYLLVVRLTRCRVETEQRRPCRWLVRGLLGTCKYHVGYKRSLPVLVRGTGFVGLPTFMWPRDDFVRASSCPERQPPPGARGPAATSARARLSGYERGMMVIGIAGVVVALASLVLNLFFRLGVIGT